MAWVYASNHKPGIQINLNQKSFFIDDHTYMKRFFYPILTSG